MQNYSQQTQQKGVFSPLTTPLIPEKLSLTHAQESFLNTSESASEGAGKGVVKGVRARGQLGACETVWLRCPVCDKLRRDWFYQSGLPLYLTCDGCQRTVPTPAWLLVAIGEIGQQPQKLAVPKYLSNW